MCVPLPVVEGGDFAFYKKSQCYYLGFLSGASDAGDMQRVVAAAIEVFEHEVPVPDDRTFEAFSGAPCNRASFERYVRILLERMPLGLHFPHD